jgi:hypothetical protein
VSIDKNTKNGYAKDKRFTAPKEDCSIVLLVSKSQPMKP